MAAPQRPWRLWLALGAAILAVAAAAYQAVSIRQRIDSTPDKPEVAARKAGPSEPAVQPLTPSLSPATGRRAPESLTEESLRREMTAAAASLAQRFGDKPEALLALAAERRWQGKTAEAAERFKQCLATEPRCADAYVGLALLADQNGDAEAAAEWARRAVAIDPNSSYAARLLAHSLLSAGEFEKVIEVMEREVRLGRPSKWVFFLLGQAYSQTSAFEKARGAFARAVELAPDFTQACYGLSVACAGWGETRKPRGTGRSSMPSKSRTRSSSATTCGEPRTCLPCGAAPRAFW